MTFSVAEIGLSLAGIAIIGAIEKGATQARDYPLVSAFNPSVCSDATGEEIFTRRGDICSNSAFDQARTFLTVRLNLLVVEVPELGRRAVVAHLADVPPRLIAHALSQVIVLDQTPDGILKSVTIGVICLK